MKRRKTRNKKKSYILYAILLLLSIGYAAYSTTLKLGGTFGIKSTNVEVLWQNPIVSDGSVEGNITINEETHTEVSFTANLQKPGDYHEFTIDAVNNSDTDAMLDSAITIFYKLEEGVESETNLPDYLRYTFTYNDGIEVKKYHLIKAHTTETYRIRLEVKKDIDIEDLPEEPATITTDVDGNYIYPNERAIERDTYDGETIALLKRGPIVNNMMFNMVAETNNYDNVRNEYKAEHCYGNEDDYDNCNSNTNGHYNNTDQFSIGSHIKSIKRATAEEYNIIKNTLTTDNLISSSTSGSKYNDYHIATRIAIEDIESNEYIQIIQPDSKNALPVYMWYNADNETMYYYTEADKIYLNPDSSGLFSVMTKLNYLDLSDFDSSYVTNMKHMFDSTKVDNIDFSKLNTSRVTNMEAMFSTSVYTSLDLSSFDTSKVTNMEGIFSSDSFYLFSADPHKMLNLSNWDFSNLNNDDYENYIFDYPGSLEYFNYWGSKVIIDNLILDNTIFGEYAPVFSIASIKNASFNNVDTSKTKYMDYMFNGWDRIEKLDLSDFDTSNVISMSYMFSNCRSLTNIDKIVNQFDTSKVTDMSYMFSGCNTITSLNKFSFDTSSVTDMYGMFENCDSLTNLSTHNLDTSKVTNMSRMFENCDSLTSLSTLNLDTSEVTDMSYMFASCDNLINVDIINLDTSKVINMSYMFYNCSNLTDISTNLDTSKVANMSHMFYNCDNLTILDLSNFNTSKVNDMSYMFSNCNNLTILDLSSFNTPNLANMKSMFEENNKLTTIYVSSQWTTEKVTGLSYYSNSKAFYNCTSIVGGNGTTYDSNHVDKEYARIDTSENPGYFTELNPTTTYKVRLNANGGSVSKAFVIINRGDAIGTLPTPTRDDYTFAGWYTGLTDGIQVSSSTIPSDNVTYYAHWTQSSSGGGSSSGGSSGESCNFKYSSSNNPCLSGWNYHSYTSSCNEYCSISQTFTGSTSSDRQQAANNYATTACNNQYSSVCKAKTVACEGIGGDCSSATIAIQLK